jgi:hypothetical protein
MSSWIHIPATLALTVPGVLGCEEQLQQRLDHIFYLAPGILQVCRSTYVNQEVCAQACKWLVA